MWVGKPVNVRGYWSVTIRAARHPLSRVIEKVKCYDATDAWNTFRNLRKQIANEPPTYTEITAELEHQTREAYLLIVNDKKHWVPKTVVKSINGDKWLIDEHYAWDKGLMS